MESASILTYLAYISGSTAFAALLAFATPRRSVAFPGRLLFANAALLVGGAVAGAAFVQRMPETFAVFPATLGLLGAGFAFAPNQRTLRWAAFGAATAGYLFCMQFSLEPVDHLSEADTSQDTELELAASQYREELPSPFVTDLGRPIRAARFYGTPPTHTAMAQAHLKTLSVNGLRDRVLRVSDDWLPANCHGYVFASSNYRLLSEEVERILEDNAYRPVGTPRAGDLAIYRNHEGIVTHTGLVRAVDPKRIYVESKWGRLGVFLHPHDLSPYVDSDTVFYRSFRRGHALARRDLTDLAE